MKSIAELTGQAEVRRQIQVALASTNCKLIRVIGPSGTGKTWLGRSIGEEWKRSNGVMLYAAGDEFFWKRSYYPLQLAISSESARLQLGVIKKAAAEAGKSIPVGGAALRELLGYLFNRRDNLREGSLSYMDSAERDILARMESLAGKRNVLLICDNFQWWDRSSLELLNLCIKKQVRRAFPFLTKLKILALETSGVACAEPDYIESLFCTAKGISFALAYCDEDAFCQILQAFGVPKKLPRSILKDLYKICCGHLDLARRLAEYEQYWSRDEQQGLHVGLQQILRDLLERRLHGISPAAEETMRLLQAASIIGNSFGEAELSCLVDLPIERMREALKPAEVLRLVNMADTGGVFTHDVVRTYFFDRTETLRKDLNRKFAYCLVLLHPGDYSRRVEYLLRAEESIDAEETLILDYLSDRRKGQSQNFQLVFSSLNQDLKSYLAKIENAIAQFENGEYREAIETLETIEDIYPDRLLAERDIMAARCQIKRLTRKARMKAIKILQRWHSASTTEPEIWCRVMLYTVVAYIFLGDVEAASQTETALLRKLRGRLKFDPAAEQTVNHCRLKANMLHTSVVARQRLQDAVAFFGPLAGGAPADPVHYYIGLVNLSANYICDGDFESAFGLAVRANQVVRESPAFSFPRRDILGNNLILSAVLYGRLTAKKAAESMQKMIRTVSPSNDTTLLKSNLAWLHALTGDYKTAAQYLEPVFHSLTELDEVDGYYPYFIGNNLAGAIYMLGDRERSAEIWHQLDGYVTEIAGPIAPYIARRHELQSILFSAPETPHQNWALYLNQTHNTQVGPGWRFYGNGFLASELEFWSDE